jgi:hypothetical protein
MAKPSRIKFVGKDAAAPGHIIDGKTRIDLPADQKKPFTHEHAKRILKVMPELYKPVKPKGKAR